jgi:hypothetical protein
VCTGGSFSGSLKVGAPPCIVQVKNEWSYSSTPSMLSWRENLQFFYLTCDQCKLR